ncbi:hypothetical protein [Limnohabitans sp.]|uniref:hypothetical protein n=1 Tax=Limnohabitans sp. TaxID=1907725 RepID=UPI0038B9464E
MNRTSLSTHGVRWLMGLSFGLVAWQGAGAQTFKMPCQVEGVIPALDDRKIPPEKIEVEIQSMGKNIFLKVNGSKLYQVQASSLTTDDFAGKNLTSSKQLGAVRKHQLTGFVSEVRIERETVTLYAYHDIVYRGKNVRLQFEGPCTLPAQ